MKRTAAVLVSMVLLTTQSAGALFENRPDRPTPEEYEEAAGIGSSEFLCVESLDELEPVQQKILKYQFIKKPKTQRFAQICMAGSTILLLREETWGDQRKIRAGQFWFGENRKYIEPKGHELFVTCHMEEGTELFEMEYLCYNPTVGAGQTGAIEYQFNLQTKRSYERMCTYFFANQEKKDCGVWKRVK